MSKQGTQYWLKKIAEQELPAITSTAHLLDKFAADDVKSLPQLTQSIMYDQGLASCLLKVANTLPHIAVSKVTTVSRAAVVLGIHAVKNICLTSKLLDAMVRNKDMSQALYQHILQLMASSFHAGIVAKMMVADYSDETQEEVYLAAMLYRVGETAFWNAAGEQGEHLVEQLDLPIAEFLQHFEQSTQTNFHDLTVALAEEWRLPDLLIKALDAPTSRTIEMQIIYFADKLCRYIAHPPNSIHEFNELLHNIAEIMQISEKQLKLRLERARKQAISLLVSYGADMLIKYIKPLPTLNDFNQQAQVYVSYHVSRERQQLQALQELTHLAQTGKDVNRLLKRAIESIVDTIQFERCSFLMLNKEKTQVNSRFHQNAPNLTDRFMATINLKMSDNIINLALKNSQALLVNDYKEAKWRDYMTKELRDIVADGSFCLASVTLDERPLGVILAQNLSNKVQISQDDFASFSLFIDTLNLCLLQLRNN